MHAFQLRLWLDPVFRLAPAAAGQSWEVRLLCSPARLLPNDCIRAKRRCTTDSMRFNAHYFCAAFCSLSTADMRVLRSSSSLLRRRKSSVDCNVMHAQHHILVRLQGKFFFTPCCGTTYMQLWFEAA